MKRQFKDKVKIRKYWNIDPTQKVVPHDKYDRHRSKDALRRELEHMDEQFDNTIGYAEFD